MSQKKPFSSVLTETPLIPSGSEKVKLIHSGERQLIFPEKLLSPKDISANEENSVIRSGGESNKKFVQEQHKRASVTIIRTDRRLKKYHKLSVILRKASGRQEIIRSTVAA